MSILIWVFVHQTLCGNHSIGTTELIGRLLSTSAFFVVFFLSVVFVCFFQKTLTFGKSTSNSILTARVQPWSLEHMKMKQKPLQISEKKFSDASKEKKKLICSNNWNMVILETELEPCHMHNIYSICHFSCCTWIN